MNRILISFVVVVASVCCVAQEGQQRQPDVSRLKSEALEKIDQEQCKADGGEIKEVGMYGLPTCVITYKDAGKSCKDGSECEGRCITHDKALQLGDAATGQCQAESISNGCYADVENGTATPFMCVD